VVRILVGEPKFSFNNLEAYCDVHVLILYRRLGSARV